MEKYKKQEYIINELKRRIKDGVYTEKLPKSKDLAVEFGVNFKTIDKAVNKLVGQGLVIRKRRAGTLITTDRNISIASNLIELLFVGSAEISVHPYYSEIWKGLLDGLTGTKYKLILTMLEENPESGGLKKVCRQFTPAAARILIGTNSQEQINVLKKQKVPFILIGNKPFDNIPAVYPSVFKALKSTLKKLIVGGLRKIAYIGPTTSQGGDNLSSLEKFYAYIAATEETYGLVDHSLIIDTPPFAAMGYPAMKTLLERATFDAVYVAFDHLCPGVYRAIREFKMDIPDDMGVISTDGLDMHLYPDLFSLKVDRHRLGWESARLLKKVISNRAKKKKIKPVVVEYEAEKEFYGSIRLKDSNVSNA